MGTLIELLENTAQQYPNQTALIFSGNKIEYNLLNEATKRLATGLRELGIKKGDRVAIMLPNVPHFCISYYGVLRLGAIVVPINIMYNKEEIQYHLKDSGASVFITWSGFYSHALPAIENSPECHHILVLGDNIPKGTKALTHIISESQPLTEPVQIEDTDLAVINYTSGVSDAPLGAELTHGTMYSNAVTCSDMFRFTSEDKLIAVLPLFHPLGQTLVMNSTLSAGGGIVLMPRFSPEEIIKAVQENKVTFMAAVPGMFKNLIELDQEDISMPSLKYCMSYGSKLPVETIEAFEEKFHSFILQSYGLTEAGPLVTSTRLNRERKVGSAGLPLVGVDIQIRDDSGKQLRPYQSGEIWTNSPNIMSGYYNNTKETQKRLVNGWLFTGDIGYIDEEYYLFIQERKENIIIKGGFQIFPHEVEKTISEHSDIEEVAVIGVPDPVLGSEVKAFIVLKENKQITAEDVQKFCKPFLPIYKTPKYIEFLSALPKSPTGRVLKRLLRNKIEKHQTVPELHNNNPQK